MARENSEHGPGLKGDFEGMRQHQHNARGEGPIEGRDFGVSPYPGTRKIDGDRKIEGMELSDKERGIGKTVPVGGGYMDASRNPDHGPHGHKKGKFELAGE